MEKPKEIWNRRSLCRGEPPAGRPLPGPDIAMGNPMRPDKDQGEGAKQYGTANTKGEGRGNTLTSIPRGNTPSKPAVSNKRKMSGKRRRSSESSSASVHGRWTPEIKLLVKTFLKEKKGTMARDHKIIGR